MVDITIQHKRSSQTGRAPTTEQLELGELAVNTYDGDLYLKKNVDGVETVVTLQSSISGATTDWPDVTNTPTTIAGYGITDAFSGDYDDLTDKPDLTLYQLAANAFDGDYNSLVNLPTLFNGQFSALSNKPTTIAGYGITDAFDGDYSSLANTPTVPVDVSDLTDTGSLIFSGSWNDLADKPNIVVNLADVANVSNTTPANNEVLKWNGSEWAPGVDTGDTNADTLDTYEATDFNLQLVSTHGATTNNTITIGGLDVQGDVSTNAASIDLSSSGDITLNSSTGADINLVGRYVEMVADGDQVQMKTFEGAGVPEITYVLGTVTSEVQAKNNLRLQATGTQAGTGDVVIAPKSTRSTTIEGTKVTLEGNLVFDTGSFNTTVQPTTATAARTLTLPDNSGTVALTSDVPSLETSTLDDVIGRGNASANTAVISFTYGTQLGFPSASTYPGAIAHSQAADALFFANDGSWVQLAKYSDVSDAYTPTTSSDWNGTAPTTITDALDRLATLVKSLNGGTGA